MTNESINWIEHLLNLTCVNVQLTPTQIKSAEDKYGAISKWLGENDSPLLDYAPVIYPQGSLVLGTTVRPLGGEDYDLDLVCLLDFDSSVHSPAALFSLVLGRMQDTDTYKGKLTPGKRHIRIDYANEFHLDIVPACPDRSKGGSFILIPDKPEDSKLTKWRSTNPKGFAEWFKGRTVLTKVFAKAAMVEPFPEIEKFEEMSPLKHAVQLIKRWRNIVYKGNLENAPSSILLSTIIADKYTGAVSVVDSVSDAILSLEQSFPTGVTPQRIFNPSNKSESLNDLWLDKPEIYGHFVSNLKKFKDSWNTILTAQNAGIDTISSGLEKLFGEDVRNAVKKHASLILGMRKGQKLGLEKTGKIVVYGSGVIPKFTNPTFYGK